MIEFIKKHPLGVFLFAVVTGVATNLISTYVEKEWIDQDAVAKKVDHAQPEKPPQKSTITKNNAVSLVQKQVTLKTEDEAEVTNDVSTLKSVSTVIKDSKKHTKDFGSANWQEDTGIEPVAGVIKSDHIDQKSNDFATYSWKDDEGVKPVMGNINEK